MTATATRPKKWLPERVRRIQERRHRAWCRAVQKALRECARRHTLMNRVNERSNEDD